MCLIRRRLICTRSTHGRTLQRSWCQVKNELCAPDQAKRELVESYKRLRTEDAAPGSSTSYRITVRQLEALVRLSEALARLRCSEVITPAYVREVRLSL